GGASSLLSLPAGGVTLADKRAVTDRLLRSGADIRALNTVRKHLSRIKGGRLARVASPARVLGLVLSDVAGDPIDVIASGPTAPDPTTFAEARAILERYDPQDTLPAGPREHLRDGEAGKHPETPKPGDRHLCEINNVIVGNNRDALEAVRDAALERGYDARIVSGALAGEARDAAAAEALEAREARAHVRSGAAPAALLWGGETTVTVRGSGRGGRNTEAALAFAMAVDGLPDVVGLFAGTDGTDGPTDAAGAIATGETGARARGMGLDPRAFLDQNDSYSFFERAGGLLMTGPTMTNVMDVHIVLVG
ncbi:MAG: glycerate kinase, partial [Myxococcota bacterium]